MYRKITAIVIPTLIAIAIILYMLGSVKDQLLDALIHIVPEYLAAAMGICLLAWWLRGWRYHTILAGMDDKVSVRTATGCIFVSQTVNLIVPFRIGDVVRIFILNHENDISYSDGISSIVVERIFDIITVALLGLIALPFILRASGNPAYIYAMALVVILGIFFFIFLFFSDRLKSENRYLRIILSMLHEIRRASLTPRSIVLLGCSSLVIWMLDVLVCLSVILMFRQEMAFPTVVFAIVVGNLIKAVPITPGGMGTYEFLVAQTLSLAGMPDVYAKLVAIIDHLIKNLITVAGGIISMYFFGDWVIPNIKKAWNNRLDRGDSS